MDLLNMKPWLYALTNKSIHEWTFHILQQVIWSDLIWPDLTWSDLIWSDLVWSWINDIDIIFTYSISIADQNEPILCVYCSGYIVDQRHNFISHDTMPFITGAFLPPRKRLQKAMVNQIHVLNRANHYSDSAWASTRLLFFCLFSKRPVQVLKKE